ncbi:MAG: glutathione S-transferase family protein [Sphingomonadales bacterium]|nr:glutathione S-transferase family protein [Sphingomonadales bacterium]
MPLDPAAETVITAFHAGPPAVQGLVRDLRLRWAFEEIGRPYRAETFDAFAPRSAEYLQRQPFNQVPAFDDGHQPLFETGAILLYLGEQDERLLPRDPGGRWQAITWAFAALSSVEPAVSPLVVTNMIHRDKPWADPAREAFLQHTHRVLGHLSEALAGKDWIAGTFSIADILLATVLRPLDRTPGLLDGYPVVAAYKARAEGRPAFHRALADHLAAFQQHETAGEPA